MDNTKMMHPPSPVLTSEGVCGDKENAIPVAEDEVKAHLALGWTLATPPEATKIATKESTQASDKEGEE